MQVHLVFVSESNVCRSVLAEAIFSQMIEEMGLKDVLACESKVLLLVVMDHCSD